MSEEEGEEKKGEEGKRKKRDTLANLHSIKEEKKQGKTIEFKLFFHFQVFLSF